MGVGLGSGLGLASVKFRREGSLDHVRCSPSLGSLGLKEWLQGCFHPLRVGSPCFLARVPLSVSGKWRRGSGCLLSGSHLG